MGFIVIEGLDGSGKSTQLKHIETYFESKGINTRFIHFPRMDTEFWGEMISRFLRGELGDIKTVDPYLIALIYGADRKDAASMLQEWMDNNYVVIADRYLYSNIAFQCAKLDNGEDRDKLAKWIKRFEYAHNNIPKPDLNLFLNVPFHFTQKSLRSNRNGSDREYLDGAMDIHEQDLSFQQRVREIYLWQVTENSDFEAVNCSDEKGNMLSPENISRLIIDKIEQKIQI